MAYRLFVDSSTGVTINPEWSMKFGLKKNENRFRSRDASEWVYKWSEYRTWKIPVEYVNSSFMAVVNSWCSSNADLLFKSESETAVYSVHITNKDFPITEYVMPYDTLFKGVINLEVY